MGRIMRRILAVPADDSTAAVFLGQADKYRRRLNWFPWAASAPARRDATHRPSPGGLVEAVFEAARRHPKP